VTRQRFGDPRKSTHIFDHASLGSGLPGNGTWELSVKVNRSGFLGEYSRVVRRDLHIDGSQIRHNESYPFILINLQYNEQNPCGTALASSECYPFCEMLLLNAAISKLLIPGGLRTCPLRLVI
jgi:hypothetical protein